MAAWSGFLWAHAHLVRALDSELEREHGIPLATFDVLFQLSIAVNHGLRMSELADTIVLTRTGLTDLVDRLESDGLVDRERSENDPSDIAVRITDRGLDMLALVTQTHIAGIKKYFLQSLSKKQTQQLAIIWQALKLSLQRS
jgi:DNA-binding MarR family transcriptional regulator